MSEQKPDHATRALAAEHGVNVEPDPVPTNAPSAHDLLIERIRARKAFGQAKYGTVLQFDNGRDHLQDMLDEMIDACAYVTNEITAREQRAGSLPSVRGTIVAARVTKVNVDENGDIVSLGQVLAIDGPLVIEAWVDNGTGRTYPIMVGRMTRSENAS